MSEAKRVAFSTISSSINSSAGSPAYRTVGSSSSLAINKTTSQLFGNTAESETTTKTKDGAENNSSKTFRLELPLFQSNSDSYPEFNYSRLLQLEKKKLKKMKTRTNGFPDNVCENTNNDDVARIARDLEKKYGTAYGRKRSRHRKIDNCDKGMGYDETDSFIDNTEAYDEIIPEEVETIEGGFYINCGALEFKKLQTELTTTKTDEIIKMPNRPKKRILSTSSSEESSSSDDEDGNEAIDDDEEADEEEAEDSSTTTNNNKGHKSGNSSSTSVTTTVKNSKLFNKNYKDGGQKSSTALSCSSSNSPKPLVEELNSDSDKERAVTASAATAASMKTTTVKDMLKAKRDTFLKTQGSDRKNSLKGQEKSVSEDEDSSSSTDDSEDSSDSTEQSNKKAENGASTAVSATVTEENSEKVEIKLPSGLSNTLLDKVQAFKEYASSKDMLNKKFQFDENLIKCFLEIDDILLTLDKTQRNLVFAHLEFHLQQPKYFFLRKSKQLRIKEEKVKNNRALSKLSRAVIEIMPTVIANYEIELRKCADLHASHVNVDQPPVMPKKEFSWNKNMRNLLYEVYEVRLSSFEILRTRKESIDDFIINYMRSKVTEVWPNGWMQLEELQREIEKCKISRANKLNRENKKNKNLIPTANNNNNNNINNISSDTTTSTTAANLVTNLVTQGMPTENPNNFLPNPFPLQQIQQPHSTSNKRKSSDSSGAPKSRKNKSQKKDNTNEMSNKKFHIPGANENSNLQQQQPFVINLENTNDALTASTFISLHQQQPQQHSKQATTANNHNNKTNLKPAHIIDLDNYKSAQDIITTSKQLLNADQQASTIVPKNLSNQHDSSSESDGVEIISVYHPQAITNNNNNNNIKYKHKNLNFQNAFSAHATSLYTGTTTTSTITITAPEISATNHNISNNNPSSNKQKQNKSDLESININKIKNSKGLELLDTEFTATLPSTRNLSTLPTTSDNPQHHNQSQQ